jgi:predicted dehydrogenase/nucleoside-diphosphate-sugar epimerase
MSARHAQIGQPRRLPLVARAVRLAVIGCGAIAEQMHLPVLAGHEGVEPVALVDRDLSRARKLADGYGVKLVFRDADDLSADDFDAAIIATPPFHHAPCSIGLMRRGIHVLVEKPMALNLAEAEEMCRVAEENGVVLAVGLYKRLLPVTRLLRSLIANETYGRALNFRVEWGGIGGFASATLGLMRKEQAGGGVLMDLGSHLIDQMLAIFGGAESTAGQRPAPRVEVLEYRDDARGGIEADGEATLRLFTANGPVEGTLVLSRVRNLSNRWRIECERAVLEAAVNERFEVTVRPQGDGLEDHIVRAPGRTDLPWFEAYRAEIDDFLAAIAEQRQPELSGRSVLPSVRVIEECYRVRQPLAVPWLDEMPLNSAGTVRVVPEASGAGNANGTPTHCVGAPVPTTLQKVLITGASGFIGCRVAEILALRDGVQVRGMVHNPGSASRLARLPVEMVQGDLKSDESVERLVEGCDAVVHCAIGTAYGNRREIFAVTVDGTRRLAAAARKAGVARFVHLSTMSVHGRELPAVLDESCPIRPGRGDDYGESKAAAEREIQRAVQAGLPAVILRPTGVYGPFAPALTLRGLPKLARGELSLVESACDSPAQTVYIDNLAVAVVASLSLANFPSGEAILIDEDDGLTWRDFWRDFADALAVPPPTVVAGREGPSGPARRGGWLQCAVETRELLRSAEFKALGRKALYAPALGWVPRQALQSRWVEERLRALVGSQSANIYQRENGTGAGAREPMVIDPVRTRVSAAKARRLLGYHPAVSRAAAVELTVRWAQHTRLV